MKKTKWLYFKWTTLPRQTPSRKESQKHERDISPTNKRRKRPAWKNSAKMMNQIKVRGRERQLWWLHESVKVLAKCTRWCLYRILLALKNRSVSCRTVRFLLVLKYVLFNLISYSYTNCWLSYHLVLVFDFSSNWQLSPKQIASKRNNQMKGVKRLNEDWMTDSMDKTARAGQKISKTENEIERWKGEKTPENGTRLQSKWIIV